MLAYPPITRRVGQIYADVPRIAEVRQITYPAYLTLPPGRPERKLPLIVMPHGGPQTRDRIDFDWWAQALAKALKKVDKPVEFVTLAKEDHYLSRSETHLQMLSASLEFLRKYNPRD